MTKILIDVDDAALRETAERLRRARALACLTKLGESGAFDELLDETPHRG